MMEALAKGLAEAGNTTTSNMNMEKNYTVMQYVAR